MMVDEVINDLRAVARFLSAQGGDDIEGLLARQYTAVKARLDTMPNASAQQCAALTMAINEGPWSSEQKCSLAAVVARTSAQTGKRRAMQTCMHFEQYMTMSEWQALRTRALRAGKINQIAQRCWVIGLTCPTERTVQKIATVLITCEQEYGQHTEKEIFDIYQNLKNAIKHNDKHKPYPHQHVVNFPMSPLELPPEIFRYAYPEDGPVQIDETCMHAPAVKKLRGMGRGDGPKEDSVLMKMLQRFMPVTMSPSATDGMAFCALPGASTQSNSPHGSPDNGERGRANMLAFKPWCPPPSPEKSAPLAITDASADVPAPTLSETTLGTADTAADALEKIMSHPATPKGTAMKAMKAAMKDPAKVAMKKPLKEKPMKAMKAKLASAKLACGKAIPMPRITGKEHPPPVDYMGCRIYTSLNKRFWLVSLSMPWRKVFSDKPEDAWKVVLAKVQAYKS